MEDIDGNIYNRIGGEFKACSGVWIGAKVGIFCANMKGEKSKGFADFDWVRLSR